MGDWLRTPASLQAATLAEVTGVLFAGAAVLFVFTMALLALALRRRKRELPARWWIWGAGIVMPGVLLSALLAYSVWRTAGLERAPPGALVIGISGHAWWWEVRYHDAAGGRWVVAANELRLPAGRPVQIGLTSDEVLHSLWVPALGGKMDLVPGRTNRLVVTARAPGVHRGVCAEFCGTQHARMALPVVVETPADFERWLAAQAQPATAPAAAQLQRGQRAFVDHGCGGCHAVRGVTSGPGLGTPRGPDLTHVGSRLQLGAGTLANDRAALERWIADVQAFKPGARMPSFVHVDAATREAIAAYLSSLR